MKRIIAICAALILTAIVFAQAPNKMSYQAVIRNSSNALVTNQAIGMRISILQDSSSGTAVYVETQTPTTNANGLVSIEIGGGTVVSGAFSTIGWANGPYFVKTETDPAGGTSYSITGTSQLLSVPYALHAKAADSLTTNIAFLAGNKVNDVILPAMTISNVDLGVGNYRYFNDGLGYDTLSGKFVAPVNGVYQFNANVYYTSSTGAIVQFFLRDNGGKICETIEYVPAGVNGNGNITFALTVNLQAGVSIWLEEYSDNPLTIHQYSSTFSGHLIHKK